MNPSINDTVQGTFWTVIVCEENNAAFLGK
jgi:hypothetical protein